MLSLLNDRMLRDINECDLLFGRKIVRFSEDFCHVLLVECRGIREQQINASLVSFYMWPALTKLSLTENMCARLDPNFSNILL